MKEARAASLSRNAFTRLKTFPMSTYPMSGGERQGPGRIVTIIIPLGPHDSTDGPFVIATAAAEAPPQRRKHFRKLRASFPAGR